MAPFSPKLPKLRSISLPARSHPTTLRVEDHLSSLKSSLSSSSSSSSAPSVESICHSLASLAHLYQSLDDLLQLPLTQQALSLHHRDKWIDHLLDCPLTFLDILANTRDSILSMEEGVRLLQSSLRRSRHSALLHSHVSSYWNLRKNASKSSTTSILLLKHIDSSFQTSFLPLDLNHHLSALVRVLTEATIVTASVFYSMLAFLSSPVLKSKPNNRWALLSRLMQKGALVGDNQEAGNINELEKADFAVNSLIVSSPTKDADVALKIQHANTRLEDLVVGIDKLENGLGRLFKHLINNRVSFLNVVYQ